MINTYINPVYNHPAPDPFVFKHCGEYWCTFTGMQPDGRCFGILKSTDLVHWAYCGSAMDRLAAEQLEYADTCYWAPEVTYDNGKFYLYYSVGDEENMQIRVALSDEPGGPFVDSGSRLTSEKFAIDAHVFTDEDGRRYLFYTRDELTRPRIGTGTVMDRLMTPFELAGQPNPVTLAQFDWQIYDPQRANKGGVCWHTLEGSFVLKHNAQYYQMFSGGNWQNESYGVAYAVTADLNQTGEWRQVVDGVRTFPLLRTIAGEGILGPGHNSVVRGLDNRELFCVYHRWNQQTRERVMAIDRLTWEDDRLVIQGPTSQLQAAPRPPKIRGFAGFMTLNGAWNTTDEAACSTLPDSCTRLPLAGEAQVIEVSIRQLDCDPNGRYGFALADKNSLLEAWIDPEHRQLEIRAGGEAEIVNLPDPFNASAFHLLRIETGGGQVQIKLDWLAWHGRLAVVADELRFMAVDGRVELRGFAAA